MYCTKHFEILLALERDTTIIVVLVTLVVLVVY